MVEQETNLNSAEKAKNKFKKGEIDQKVLDDLVEEYERKLIEIEVKLKK